MRDGAPLIYQAQFFDGHWQGRADFLRRVAASVRPRATLPMRCSTPSWRGRSSRRSSTSSASTTACSARCRDSTRRRARRARRRIDRGGGACAAMRRCTAIVVRRLEAMVARAGEADVPRAGRALRDLRAWPTSAARGWSPTTTSAWSRARGAISASASLELGLPRCSRSPRPRASSMPGRSAPSGYASCTIRPQLQVEVARSGLPTHRHLAPARHADTRGFPTEPR